MSNIHKGRGTIRISDTAVNPIAKVIPGVDYQGEPTFRIAYRVKGSHSSPPQLRRDQKNVDAFVSVLEGLVADGFRYEGEVLIHEKGKDYTLQYGVISKVADGTNIPSVIHSVRPYSRFLENYFGKATKK